MEHQNTHWEEHQWSCAPFVPVPPQRPQESQIIAPVNGSIPQPMVTVDQAQLQTSASTDCAGEDIGHDINMLVDSSSGYELTHPVGLNPQSLFVAGSDSDYLLMSSSCDENQSATGSGFTAIQELPHPQTFIPDQPSPGSSSASSPQAIAPEPAPEPAPVPAPVSSAAPSPPSAMPTLHSTAPNVQHKHTSRNKDCQLTPNIVTHQKSKEKEIELAEYVVKSLHKYGLCVIDNFLGETKCTQILGEVLQLDSAGLMTAGQLCNPKNIEIATKIREDKIAWIEKGDIGHRNISYLIGRLDALIMQCNGRLQQYDISGRTKVRFIHLMFCSLFTITHICIVSDHNIFSSQFLIIGFEIGL